MIDIDSRLVERWRQHVSTPGIVIESLVWHPTGAAEPFVLDLPKYFADVSGEPTA